MATNELPISQPPIVCYLHHAYPLTAAMAHKDFNSWVFSNYIQLEYNLNYKTLNFFTFVICGNCIYIPIVDYKVLDSEYLSMSHINIIDFIMNSIDMGYYVTIYLDEFFVPERLAFKKWHQRHETMIFGYDSKEKLLRIIGYNDKVNYSKSNISFSKFEEAYSNSINKQNDVILFKAKDEMSFQPSFEFDINNVKDLLQDYLLSRDTCDRLRIFGNPKNGHVYGIQVYQEIIKYCQSAIINKEKCDIKLLHLLWEHKKIMVSRIEYLAENSYIKGSNELLTTYNDLKNTALQLRNKLIKYNLSSKQNLIETTIDVLNQMYEVEKEAVEDLLKNIYDTQNKGKQKRISERYYKNE